MAQLKTREPINTGEGVLFTNDIDNTFKGVGEPFSTAVGFSDPDPIVITLSSSSDSYVVNNTTRAIAVSGDAPTAAELLAALTSSGTKNVFTTAGVEKKGTTAVASTDRVRVLDTGVTVDYVITVTA